MYCARDVVLYFVVFDAVGHKMHGRGGGVTGRFFCDESRTIEVPTRTQRYNDTANFLHTDYPERGRSSKCPMNVIVVIPIVIANIRSSSRWTPHGKNPFKTPIRKMNNNEYNGKASAVPWKDGVPSSILGYSTILY